MALSERRFGEAKAKATRALALNAEEDPEIDARYILAVAKSFSGQKREARSTCEEAVEAARQKQDSQMLPNALVALAEVLVEGDDPRAALAAAREAQGLLERAGRRESELRACLLAGRASQLAGESAAAHEYLARAEGLLAGLEDRWGAEAYNTYLTRPDVRQSRQQLSRLLGVNQ